MSYMRILEIHYSLSFSIFLYMLGLVCLWFFEYPGRCNSDCLHIFPLQFGTGEHSRRII